MGKFFPDYSSFGTGNPMLDHISGFSNKKSEEERDPFDPEAWADFGASFEADPAAAAAGAGAAPAAPAAPASVPERLLQQKKFINPKREAKRKSGKKKTGLDAGAAGRGLETSGGLGVSKAGRGLKTYGRGGIISGDQQGGFGRQ
jgi:hypothetical protein